MTSRIAEQRAPPRTVPLPSRVRVLRHDEDSSLELKHKSMEPYPEFVTGASLISAAGLGLATTNTTTAEISGEAAAATVETHHVPPPPVAELQLEADTTAEARSPSTDDGRRTAASSRTCTPPADEGLPPGVEPEGAHRKHGAPGSVVITRHNTVEENDVLVEQSILSDASTMRSPYEALIEAMADVEASRIARSKAQTRLDACRQRAALLSATDASRVEEALLREASLAEAQQRDDAHSSEKGEFIQHELGDARRIQWIVTVLHGLTGYALVSSLIAGRDKQNMIDTLTPFVRRKIAFWRSQAVRATRTFSKAHNIRAPTIAQLRQPRHILPVRHTSVVGTAKTDPPPFTMTSFFADWPEHLTSQLFDAAIQNVRSGRGDPTVNPLSYAAVLALEGRDAGEKVHRPVEAALRAYRAGEYIYFTGDRDSDFFYIAEGAVELIMVRDHRTTSINDGYHGDVIRSVLGKPPVKRKSRAKHNGVVVEELGPHDYFGEIETLSRGARGVSALCTADTMVFVFSRGAVFQQLATIPSIVVDTLRREAGRRREEQARRSFPVLIDDLRREPRLASWDVQALGELAARLTPVELRRGDLVAPDRNQSQELAFYFVLSGVIRVTAQPTAPSTFYVPAATDTATSNIASDTLPVIEGLNNQSEQAAPLERVEIARIFPGAFYGLEAVLLGHDVYDRAHLRDVRIEPVEDCVAWVISRLSFSDLAILHPTQVVASRNIVNATYAASLQRPSSRSVPILVRDPVLRYLVPPLCVQRAWEKAAEPCLMSAGDAICRAGEAMGRPALYFVLTGCLCVRSGLDVLRPKSDYVVIRDTQWKGHVVGAFEFGVRSTTFADSVVCVSTCIVWRIDRSVLEEELIDNRPLVWSRLTSESCRETLLRRHADGTLSSVLTELFRPSDAQ